MLLNPTDKGAVHFQALLVIIFFMIAIARAWQMIGARNTRVMAMVGDLLRERGTTAVVPDAVEHAEGDTAVTVPVPRRSAGHFSDCASRGRGR